jgi:hypothetical protein
MPRCAQAFSSEAASTRVRNKPVGWFGLTATIARAPVGRTSTEEYESTTQPSASASASNKGYEGFGTRTVSPGSHRRRNACAYASLVLAVSTTCAGSTVIPRSR